jgi:hypothetical protein
VIEAAGLTKQDGQKVAVDGINFQVCGLIMLTWFVVLFVFAAVLLKQQDA